LTAPDPPTHSPVERHRIDRRPSDPNRPPGSQETTPMIRSLSFVFVLTVATLASSPARAAFPPGFLWGTAVSGFQTEMGGPSSPVDTGTDWWVWSHDPTNITNGVVSGDLPENGPGFYDHFAADIKLANRRLRSNALRLGIEWSRIFPTSTAGVDASGGITLAVLQQLDALADQNAVAHYRAVLQAIRDRAMTPFVTLSHFSLPLWLHDPIAARGALTLVGPNDPLPTGFPGGWLDATTPVEFTKYAAYIGWKLGDLVDFWAPLNEPLPVAVGGYANIPGVVAGNFPPGAFSFVAILTVITNEATAQASAYDALKVWDTTDIDGDTQGALVGLVHNMIFFRPRRNNQQVDIDGAAHANYLYNRLWPNAVILGDLDSNANGTIDSGEHHPELTGKADFFGVNYYFRADALGLGAPVTPVLPLFDFLPTTEYPGLCPSRCSDLGWEIYPEGLTTILGAAGSYGLPVYITENGLADATDAQRPAFIVNHLTVLEQAITDGVADVRGYFHWSLMDNFEWARGYPPKFGLASVDPVTKHRKLRRSARFLTGIIRKNTVPQRYKDRFPF
jgi:beta-glucosidase/6-phospho-beta-glucosidase/beta-galactosidase